MTTPVPRRSARTFAVLFVVGAAVLAVSATSPPDVFSATETDTWTIEVDEGELIEGSVTYPDGLGGDWQSSRVSVSIEAQPAPALARLVLVDAEGEPLLTDPATGEPQPLQTTFVDGTAVVGHGTRCSREMACDEPVGYRVELLEADGPVAVRGEVRTTLEARGEDEVPSPPLAFADPAVVPDLGDDPPAIGTEVVLEVDADRPVDAVRLTLTDEACETATTVTQAGIPPGVSVEGSAPRAQLLAAIATGPYDRAETLEHEVDQVVPVTCGGEPDARTFWLVLAGGPNAAESRVVVVSSGSNAPEVERLPVPESEVVAITISEGERRSTLTHELPDPAKDGRSLFYGRVLSGPLPESLTFGPGGLPEGGGASLLRGPCSPDECTAPIDLELRRRSDDGALLDPDEVTVQVEVLELALTWP